MGDLPRLRLIVELDRTAELPAGNIDDGCGTPMTFVGWAELTGAIDRAHREGRISGETDSPQPETRM